MANTVRKQIVESVAGKMADNNVSLGRHVLFGTLYIDSEPVGGMQSFSMREQNGTTFIAQAGNDWLEPRYGMRYWSGDGNRFALRGRDVTEILQLAHSGVGDMDFRFLPLTLRYHFHYKGPAGNSSYEDAMWHYATVIITDYTWRWTGPNELIYEDFSFICKGYSRADSGSQSMSTPTYLWGSKQNDFSKALVA